MMSIELILFLASIKRERSYGQAMDIAPLERCKGTAFCMGIV
jgi:hypothetical protein